MILPGRIDRKGLSLDQFLQTDAKAFKRQNEKVFRKSWARLIQKIYEVDLLVYPKCQCVIRVIDSIEDPSVIRVILEHLGLWPARSRPPSKIHDPPVCMRGTGRSAAPIHPG